MGSGGEEEEECSGASCQPHTTASVSTLTSTPVLSEQSFSEQSFTPRDYFEDQYSDRSSGLSAHGHFDAIPEWEVVFFLRSALSDICRHLKLRKTTEAHKLIREAREQLRDWREHQE